MTTAVEVGDLEVLPQLFGDVTFEFKVGFDSEIFNRGMELLGWLRRRSLLPRPDRIRAPLMGLIRALSGLGTGAGAVQVEACGGEGRYVGTLVARERGHRIPVVLASIAVARILEGRLAETRLDRWLPDPGDELARRGVELVERRS